MVAQHGWSAPRILELLEVKFSEAPSLRQLQRYIREFEEQKAAVIASMRDPDAYKSKHRLALGRADAGVDSAHQIWELDTSPADVHTTSGRVAILGLIDRYSRMTRFLVAPSESGHSVRRLLVDTITAWGVVPDAVVTDNGSGYVNKSVQSALELLEIEQIVCPPGSPEKKPFVERIFGTFTRERAAILPGFSGHNVAQAQKLRSQAKKQTGRAVIEASVGPEELQGILTAWVDGNYHLRKHSVLRMTPLAKAATSLRRPRKAPSADVVRQALTDLVGPRVIGKRGIEWRGGRYWHEALNAWMGRDVVVRRDEEDLGELLIFSPEGEFVCRAVDHERAGISEQEFAEAGRKQQAEYRNREAAAIREAARGFSIEDAVAMRLRTEAERANVVSPLMHADAKRAEPTSSEADTPPVDLNQLRRAASKARADTKRTPAEKVASADELIARADAGEAVDEMKLAAARRYAASAEYRAEKVLSARFQSRTATGGNSA